MLLEDATPSYAVPRLIFRLAKWPRSVNDKIDRAALASRAALAPLARSELRRGGVRKRGLDAGSAPPA